MMAPPRPPRRVEIAGELVGAGHRQAGRLAHQRPHPQLVGRIAHAEIAGHGEGLDLAGVLGRPGRSQHRHGGGAGQHQGESGTNPWEARGQHGTSP